MPAYNYSDNVERKSRIRCAPAPFFYSSFDCRDWVTALIFGFSDACVDWVYFSFSYFRTSREHVPQLWLRRSNQAGLRRRVFQRACHLHLHCEEARGHDLLPGSRHRLPSGLCSLITTTLKSKTAADSFGMSCSVSAHGKKGFDSHINRLSLGRVTSYHPSVTPTIHLSNHKESVEWQCSSQLQSWGCNQSKRAEGFVGRHSFIANFSIVVISVMLLKPFNKMLKCP